nr:hypothetical protein [Candidatus Dadabacteria bacterium]NIV42914.1 hypothetical protein [Candidatus Dadabacteria bacterium]NIX14878.1 hypothetical protein [Candidatus Dadabacteria bacterium]
ITRSASKTNSNNKVEIDINKRRQLFIDERTKALLLIKLPASTDNKIETNSSLVQLLDISKLVENVADNNQTLSRTDMIELMKRDQIPIFSSFEKDQQKTVNGKCVDAKNYEYYMLSEDDKWTKYSGCNKWNSYMDLIEEGK